MSDLKSQTMLSTTQSQLPILTGPATAAIFLKKARELLRSKFGEVGQNILNSTKTILEHPGPCPHYNDPRLHPITGAPIPNTRKYARITKTADQTADASFDDDTLPLTDAGEAKFNQDLKTWNTNNDRYHRLLDKHRDNDDESLGIKPATPGHLFVPRGHLFVTLNRRL